MAVCIADVTATGAVDLDAIGERFLDWFRSGPADVGIQTSAVLRGAASGADLAARAADYHARKPDSSAGNGSLMRTAPVALAHLQHALEAAVRIGHDTDTVAAIAGAVLGARWGASAIPFRWRRMLHGWPGYRAADLVRLAVLTARGGEPDDIGWPTAERLSTGGEAAYVAEAPGDDGLLLGSLGGLAQLDGRDDPVDVVVSLCRVGTQQVPADVEEHHEVWLIDAADRDSNPHLEFVLRDAVEAVAWYRAQGKCVFLHCHGGHSRTPTVAAGYLSEKLGIPATEALDRVAEVVPYSGHNRAFVGALANWSTAARDG